MGFTGNLPLMEPATFTCPACGKRYGLKPGMEGRRVACGCGKSFRVPVPEDDGEGPLELSDPSLARVPEPDPSAAPGACVRCNAPLKPGAVLCLNCGTDQRTGQRAASPPPPPPGPGDDGPDDDAPDTTRGRMTATLWGINAQIASLLLGGLNLVLGLSIAVAPPSLTAVLVVGHALVMIGGGLIGGLGSILCLAAPVPAAGLAALAVSLLCNAVTVGLDLWDSVGDAPGWVTGTSVLVGIAGLLCFLGFLLSLADSLEFPEVSQTAHRVFGYALGAIVAGVVAALLPVGACILSLGVLALAVYAFWLYASLLIDLSRSVAYRRDRG